MTTNVLRPITFGILAGSLFFLMPFFLLKLVGFFLILGFVSRLFGWRRWQTGHFAFAADQPHGGFRRAWVQERFKNMTEDERRAFFDKMGRRGGCPGRGCFESNAATAEPEKPSSEAQQA